MRRENRLGQFDTARDAEGHELANTIVVAGIRRTTIDSVATIIAGMVRSLSVAPFEQELGSCREARGAGEFEAEGVGEVVGGVERGADR